MTSFCLISNLLSFYTFFSVSSTEKRYIEKYEYYETVLSELKRKNYNRESIDNLQAYVNVLKETRLSSIPVGLSRLEFQDAVCENIMINATPCSNPLAIFLGGGTASGKSSITKKWYPLVKDSPCGYARIDPDDIMTHLPGWANLTRGQLAECAANVMNDQSSTIAFDCYEKCLLNNVTFVYDGTMANYLKTMGMVDNLHERGYQIQMFGVTVDTSTAAERAWNRAQISKRYVPLCIIWSTHTRYSENYVNYTKVIPVNQLYDTDSEIEFVATLVAVNNTVVNQTLYDRFLTKSSETLCDVENGIDNETYIVDYDQLNQECQTCSDSEECPLSKASNYTFTITLSIVAFFVAFCLSFDK